MTPKKKTTKKRSSKTRSVAADAEQLNVNVEKWTEPVWRAGWTGIPNALLHAQGRLDISPQAMSVLLQLLRRWWKKDRLPFPGHAEIMAATGMKQRTVQRAFNELADVLQLVTRKRRRGSNGGGYTSNTYDPAPLVEKLKPIAKELEAAKRERQELRTEQEAEVGRRRARKPVEEGAKGERVATAARVRQKVRRS